MRTASLLSGSFSSQRGRGKVHNTFFSRLLYSITAITTPGRGPQSAEGIIRIATVELNDNLSSMHLYSLLNLQLELPLKREVW